MEEKEHIPEEQPAANKPEKTFPAEETGKPATDHPANTNVSTEDITEVDENTETPSLVEASEVKEENMEVHHHGHVHETKKWKEYVFQFLMLFLAVFCGFLAENQREHYIEKLRARQFATSLITDLNQDKESVTVIIQQINGMISSIDSLNNYIQGKDIQHINNFELLTKFFFGRYRPFSWSRATIDQIKNSGSLRYFTNHAIVEKISVYDATTRHLDEDAIGDEERNTRYLGKLADIVDLSYPPELLEFLYGLEDARYVKDSIDANPFFKEMAKQNKKLLTNDINEVKRLVNLYLAQRPNLVTRANLELWRLIEDADELIALLKKEYHLD